MLGKACTTVLMCYVAALHGVDHRQVNVQCALLVFKGKVGLLVWYGGLYLK